MSELAHKVCGNIPLMWLVDQLPFKLFAAPPVYFLRLNIHFVCFNVQFGSLHFFCCFTTYLTAETMFSRRKSQHILREIPNLLLQLSIFAAPPLPSRTSWNFLLKSPSPAVPHGQLTPRLSPVAPPSLGHGGGFRGFRGQRGGVLGLRG